MGTFSVLDLFTNDVYIYVDNDFKLAMLCCFLGGVEEKTENNVGFY